MIHGHGDDQYNFTFELKANFSSNVRFDGCPDELLGHLKEQLPLISHYPEPDGFSLRKLIAQKHQVEPGQVLLCNGSSDGFYQIAQGFTGKRSAILYPSFSEYEDACKIHNHDLSFFTKKEFIKRSFNPINLVWLGNPNNPDGHVFEIDLIRKQLASNPNTIFIIDEAYMDLCINASSAIYLFKEFDNLIVSGSLTKTYGIPGLRLGYLLSSIEIVKKLNPYSKPWSVNSLAIEAGKYILQHEDRLQPDIKEVCRLSKELQGQISMIGGMTVAGSEAGFFLVRMQNRKASELKKYLLEKHNILIRDASNFRGLDEQYFRIGIQEKEKNVLLVDGLKQFVNNEEPIERTN